MELPVMVPTEMWEEIIDCFGEIFEHEVSDEPTFQTSYSSQYYATLQACALTCRAWLPRSRRNLFRTVVLHTPEDLARFAKIMFFAPHLSRLVLSIQLRYDGNSSWQLIEKFPMALVYRLPCMSSLHIWGSLHNYIEIGHGYFGVLSQFQSITHLHIHRLHFGSFSDFVHMVWALESLSSLMCCQAFWPEDTVQISHVWKHTQTRPALKLVKMHLHSWSSLIQLLEVLIGTSIEHLHLDVTHDGRTQPIAINDHRHVSVLTHLRSVELVVSWADYASVYGFLSLVPHIREVTLYTRHTDHEMCPDRDLSFPRYRALGILEDSSLDQLFSGSQTSQLQRLTMTFRDVMESCYFWTQAVSSRLPRTRARGILHVEIDDLSSFTRIWSVANDTSSSPPGEWKFHDPPSSPCCNGDSFHPQPKKQCFNSNSHSSRFIMPASFAPESGFTQTS